MPAELCKGDAPGPRLHRDRLGSGGCPGTPDSCLSGSPGHHRGWCHRASGDPSRIQVLVAKLWLNLAPGHGVLGGLRWAGGAVVGWGAVVGCGAAVAWGAAVGWGG